jgi:hypothetical protein
MSLSLPRGRVDRMRRREFITLLASAVVAWPVLALGQGREPASDRAAYQSLGE